MQKKVSLKNTTVDEYFSTLSPKMKNCLIELRKIIKQVVPDAEEIISYNMPAFKLNGILVWYAACKEHIGFYPSSSPIKAFKNDLKNYKTSKGAIQFLMEKPIPTALVKKIVKFRLKENLRKAKEKEQKGKTK